MTDFRMFLTHLSLRARWLFALGLVLILGLAAAGSWWAFHPGYATLATDLRAPDAAEIGTALSQWGVPYRFEDGDKTLLVPRESVYSTRMKLSAEGIPRGGSVGFEAFKDSDYGVTEFAQRINYQRALQGELQRTVESMREIRSARVHLTIHHAGMFEQEQSGSKASVTVVLRDGQQLAPRQVAGIQRLVASAVEELAPANVTLLDQGGTVLSSAEDTLAVGALVQRMDEASKLQATLRHHVEELLARALHRKDFTVSVAVRLNYDHVKRVGSRLLAQGKDGNGLLLREKTDSNRASGQGAGSNGSNSLSGREVEYAHGTEREEVEQAPGRIERISVGIVIPMALPQADIQRLSEVVSAGIGLDLSRGDRVNMVAMAPRAAPSMTPPQPAPQLAPTTPSAAPAATAALPRAYSVVRWTAPTAVYAAGAAGAVGLLAWAMITLRRRRTASLSASEREATLARIRQWIDLPERSL